MGGRGSTSSINSNEKPVSPLMAKVYFNSAKKSTALRTNSTVKRDSKLDKIIKNENTNWIKAIKNEKEAARVKDYIYERLRENNRKLTSLGSPARVHEEQKTAIEHRKLVSAYTVARDKRAEFVKPIAAGDLSAMHDPKRTTTTYDRARKRRMKEFDAWWNGSKKK